MFLAGLWFAIQGRWLGLAACMGLIIYCHNTGPCEAGAMLLVAVYLHPEKFKRLVLAGFLAALAWVPAVVHIKQMSMTVFGILQPWQATLTLSWFTQSVTQAVWMTINSHFVLGAFLLILLSAGLLFNRETLLRILRLQRIQATPAERRPRLSLLLAWSMPILLLVIASLFLFDVVLYRTLQPMLFPFVLFLGWELGSIFGTVGTLHGNVQTLHAVETLHATSLRSSPYRLILSILWILFLFTGVALWHPSARGGHLDQAAAYIRSEWKQGDVIVYSTQTVSRPFLYYISDLAHYEWPHIINPSLNEPGVPHDDSGDPASAKRIWLVLPEEFLITPEQRAAILAVYPRGDPLWHITYLQAAPINVYLEER